MAFDKAFAFDPTGRGYQTVNSVQERGGSSGGGFAGLAGLASGIADIADSAGRVGAVIDNWGAGRRAEEAQRNDNALNYLGNIHPDDLASWTPEQAAQVASSLNMSPEELSGLMTISQNSWTEDMYKQDSLRDVKNAYGSGAVEQYAQDTQTEAPPGEDQPPMPGEEPPQEEIPGEPPVEETAPPTPGDPAQAADMEQQYQNYQLQMEAEAAPKTSDDFAKIVAKQTTPIPKSQPDPVGLQKAGAQGSKAYIEYLRNQKMYAAYTYNEMTHGRTPNLEIAEEMSNRLTSSKEALAEGMKGYMLQHFDYVPPDWAPYLNDPTYFEDAVSYARFNADPKYRNEVLAKNPDEAERLRGRLSGIPYQVRNILGPAVEGSAKAQMQLGLDYMDRDLKAQMNQIEDSKRKDAFAIDMQKVGIEKSRAENEKATIARQLGLDQAGVEQKWAEISMKNKQLTQEIKIQDANGVLGAMAARAELTSAAINNRSAVYTMLGNIQQQQAQGSPASIYLKLMQMDANIAQASAKASAKTGQEPGGKFANMQGAADAGTMQEHEVAKAQQYQQQAWTNFMAQNGNAPFPLTLNGVTMMIDPTKDMLENKRAIAVQAGISDNYLRQDAALIDDVIRRYNLTPDASTVNVPQGLSEFYQYTQSQGIPLQEMNDTDFYGFLKSHGWFGRDPKGLWADYKNRLVIQRQGK